MRMQIKSEHSSTLIPNFINFLSIKTQPKMPAKMGPMIGDTSMEAVKTTLLSKRSPRAAMIPVESVNKK